MSKPARPRAADTDRHLLFGILAVQMDFIGRDALIAGMHAWVLDKARPLGHSLRDLGHLMRNGCNSSTPSSASTSRPTPTTPRRAWQRFRPRLHCVATWT